MVFSSLEFLFAFLPLTLLGAFFFARQRSLQNLWLLFVSLFFYAWGEGSYLAVMIFSISVNWLLGVWLESSSRRQMVLTVGIAINLFLLGYYKYAHFVVENLARLLGFQQVHFSAIHMPIGISFFSFQAISYLIDIYRGEIHAQKNILTMGFYKSFFPQLIAGPIVRYKDVEKELTQRQTKPEDLEEGLIRFISGLSKKVLLANPLAEVADKVFAEPLSQLTPHVAWLGILAYTFQIYFDFSGYSDMAIGLGRFFGLHFLENFKWPYGALSITQFWRRWHISLSTWFRDYLYIPLGGNQRGTARTYFNLVLVFFLCGLWHGASWCFVIWGLYHGAFLVIERSFLSRLLEKIPSLLQWLYTFIVVVIGWVFFRAENLGSALHYIQVMFDFSSTLTPSVSIRQLLEADLHGLLIVALLFSFPVPWLLQRCPWKAPSWAMVISLIVACFFVIASLVASSYNPFIYFRF